MNRPLAQTWRAALRARSTTTHVRAYARRRVGYSIEELESEKVPLIKQIQEIVHPSQHTQLQKTRTISQTAGKDESLGFVLEAEQHRRRKEAFTQLHELYDHIQSGHRRKDQGQTDQPQKLSRTEYGAFLEGFVEMGDTKGSVRILRDMRESGTQPVDTQYAMVMRAAANAFRTPDVFAVGEEMRRAGVEDYSGFFNSLLRCLGRSGQIEYAYSVYLEMTERRVEPQGPGSAALVVGLAQIGEVDTSLQVMKATLGRGTTLGQDVFMGLLHEAGIHMHHTAYVFAFRQLADVFGAQLPEGDSLAGLDVAARAGDVALAGEIVERLRMANTPLEEKHFEPLLAAVLARKQWMPAMRVLHMMRQAGYGKAAATLRPLERAVANAEEPEQLAETVFGVVADSRDEQTLAVDHVTLDALVAGLAQAGCVEAAASRLNTWYTQLGIVRSTSSYECVIEGCMARRNKTVAERMLAQLIDERLQPSQRIYEAMIHIALVQPNYEDAFVYLEAMKAHAMVPAWRTLAAIVRRCARVRDVRAQTALREMRRLGLVVTPVLASYAQNAGRSPRNMGALKTSDEPKKEEPSLNDLFDNDSFRV
ncbi:hypothetical protein EV180_004990 [Coemansia sp. RSA 518]|nr:hypothetical protein LPJ69_003251 [Coemansia sp. RSA 1752]KAJ1776423.1 hypothetical protein LPJ54_003080 [Coemansia sp. RSA 1824]KAJ1787564.1 hypothetical protein LPJ67_003162 [Coemansia sp. RSA 1938]KAJ2145133.1 hypothetical protein IW142_002759 [Coemansia sp. RSA 564]KAJ2167122.1 hypothetical protein GGH15_002323 [Coemansia sp. RSA 562]KAJ2187514.1 hypothetical protein EV181_002719 [Coemansia sp. RSA 532]KAJ2192215.1 hypothetical protein IW144_004981 [Coemansia sp. RSA 522]KAJ2220478.1 